MIETIDFKPSDVYLSEPIPLVGTFKQAESECMAGMMVATLAASSDEWVPVRPSEIGAWMRTATDSDNSVWAGVLALVQPHPHKLVSDGFCRWVEAADTPDRALEFTDKGLRAMERWVVTPEERAVAREDLATMRGTDR